MFGLNAQLFFNEHFGTVRFNNDQTMYPWGGIYFGYRLPSAEQHRLWTDRTQKRRVSRELGIEPEDDRPEKKRREEPPPIVVSESELKRMAEKEELKRLRRERMARLDLRQNGRSLFYAEGFGATGYVSVNYDYSLPLDPKALFLLTGRIGVGASTPRHTGVTMPVAMGFRVMSNYRGGGIQVGAVSVLSPNGTGVYAFVQPELQFHLAHGVVFGVQYQVLIDPDRYFVNGSRWPQYGGFMLGYRLVRKAASKK